MVSKQIAPVGRVETAGKHPCDLFHVPVTDFASCFEHHDWDDWEMRILWAEKSEGKRVNDSAPDKA